MVDEFMSGGVMSTTELWAHIQHFTWAIRRVELRESSSSIWAAQWGHRARMGLLSAWGEYVAIVRKSRFCSGTVKAAVECLPLVAEHDIACLSGHVFPYFTSKHCSTTV
jgi:hypothetical protein